MSEIAAPMLQELRTFLGASWLYEIEEMPQPHTVADSTHKFLVHLGRSAQFILIVSNTVSPLLVQRNVARMRMAKTRLSKRVGNAIELPLVEGKYGARSYALWRMRTPLSSNRLRRAIQKELITPVVAQWLAEVATETLHTGEASESVALIDRLLSVPGLSNEIRASAEVCRLGFLSGEISSLRLLQHGDLWLGNILKAPNPRGFMVIDWAGARSDGFPFFDLVKFGCSIDASAKEFRQLLENYCQSIHCSPAIALPSVLAGLGQLHQELEYFPEQQFIALCDRKFAALRSALD
jgi:hypothetical protein